MPLTLADVIGGWQQLNEGQAWPQQSTNFEVMWSLFQLLKALWKGGITSTSKK